VIKPAGQCDPEEDGRRTALTIAVAVVGPLVSALGVLGGVGSFATIRHLAVPWFGSSAWTVPVGIDVGIVALLAWDLLAEYLGLPWPVLRWTAWAFVAATTYLNIAAAHGSMAAAVMHAAMPVLFVTVVEGIRHLVRQRVGLAAGTRIERIPLSRWLLAPRTTFLLGRRMVLWNVTSYREGLALEYQRLTMVSRLQRDYGRWCWRWRAPLQERLALRLAQGDVIAATASPADLEAGAQVLRGLPRRRLTEESNGADLRVNKSTRLLIEATASILADAERDGIDLSQAAMARKLRERGHRVGNDRLRWLVATARAVLTANALDRDAAA